MNSTPFLPPKLMIAVLSVLALLGVAPGARGGLLPPVGIPVPPLNLGFIGTSSPNVEYLGTIPLSAPGVGGRVIDVGGRRRLYVSSVLGLQIYDVTDPPHPRLLGFLPLPNWENEDVSVSADGDTVLVTDYVGSLYLHVIDASTPLLPTLASTLLLDSGGHTSECLDPDCNWVYGSEGQIIDLHDKRRPVVRPETWTELLGLPDGHAINVDSAGIATIDTTPLAMVDVTDPLHPRIITAAAEGEQRANGTAYQHNNLRPRAADHVPRAPGDTDSRLRPGELILGNGETNLTGTCNGGSGPFATWSAAGFDRGAPLEVLDVHRPVSGDWSDGNPAFNVLGCSGHWFTEQPDPAGDGDYLVAAGWYEHGTRFLHVDAESGAINEVGFWQPVIGSASAAYWVGGSYAYVVDYARGIDILRFRPDAPLPSSAAIEGSWLARVGDVDILAEAERVFCRLATS